MKQELQYKERGVETLQEWVKGFLFLLYEFLVTELEMFQDFS